MQIPSPFQAYGLNWKHSGLSHVHFCILFMLLKLFLFLFHYFFKLIILHQTISIFLGRHTSLKVEGEVEGDQAEMDCLFLFFHFTFPTFSSFAFSE